MPARELRTRGLAAGLAVAPAGLPWLSSSASSPPVGLAFAIAALGLGALGWLRSRGRSISAATFGATAIAALAPCVAGADAPGGLTAMAAVVWAFAIAGRLIGPRAPTGSAVAALALALGVGAWCGDLAIVGAGAAWLLASARTPARAVAVGVASVLGAAFAAPRIFAALRASWPVRIEFNGGLVSSSTWFEVDLASLGLGIAMALFVVAAVAGIPAAVARRAADWIGLLGSAAVALVIDPRASVGVALFGGAIAAAGVDALRRARGDGGRPPRLAGRLGLAVSGGLIVAAVGVVLRAVARNSSITLRGLAHDPTTLAEWSTLGLAAAMLVGGVGGTALFLHGRFDGRWLAAGAIALVLLEGGWRAAGASTPAAVAVPRPWPAEITDDARRGAWCAGAAAIAAAFLAIGARGR